MAVKSHRETPDAQSEAEIRLIPAVQVHRPFDRMLHQFAGVAQRELFLNMSLIGLDGLDAEMQFVGNLPGSMSFANQPKDFQFAISKGHQRRGLRRRMAVNE